MRYVADKPGLTEHQLYHKVCAVSLRCVCVRRRWWCLYFRYTYVFVLVGSLGLHTSNLSCLLRHLFYPTHVAQKQQTLIDVIRSLTRKCFVSSLRRGSNKSSGPLAYRPRIHRSLRKVQHSWLQFVSDLPC